MFNVTKALKKLKEIRKEYIPENYTIDRKALEEILLAGQEDEVCWQTQHCVNELANIHRRIDSVVDRLCINGQPLDRLYLVGTFKKLEERLARLEERLPREYFETKYAEENFQYVANRLKAIEKRLGYNECTRSFEERVLSLECWRADESMKGQSKPTETMATFSEHGVEIGKPEKPVTEEKLQGFAVTWQCRKCAYVWDSATLTPTCPNCQSGNVSPKDDKPSLKEVVSECMDEIGIEAVKASKPREFISIPRSVAEEWINYKQVYMNEEKPLVDAIKQQLG